MNIHKAAGLCLIGTGLFAVTGFLLHPHESTSSNQIAWLIGHSLIFIALVLNLLGLAWILAAESEQLGVGGWVGFALSTLGLSMYIGKLYWSGLFYPLVLEASPDLISSVGLSPGSSPNALTIKSAFFAGAISFAVGHLILGITMLRSQRFQSKPVWWLMSGAFMVGIWPLMPDIVQMLSVGVSAV
ncbi:hypothetical protein [Ahrensia sp. R2A130]|uniref:hypothetical protein n=1 Tax=Ahrensia sp. R2A130 TaxID=744979 RepID=UPI00058DD31A|nr:hypothetical protein [Ahrensia sp. R2A130]